MTDRSMRWGIGLFVLIALILLGTLIVMFGSLPAMFKPSNIYTIRFVDAPGVPRCCAWKPWRTGRYSPHSRS